MGALDIRLDWKISTIDLGNRIRGTERDGGQNEGRDEAERLLAFHCCVAFHKCMQRPLASAFWLSRCSCNSCWIPSTLPLYEVRPVNYNIRVQYICIYFTYKYSIAL
jgi:hypothetical protein